MSRKLGKKRHENRFLIDRMLGTLGRYLRFMGYDTTSANSLSPGNRKEDSILLGIAASEGRILLTRDRELANRGGKRAVFIQPVFVESQLAELIDLGLVERRLLMTRCSLCNERLRPAKKDEINSTTYAPEKRAGYTFLWCSRCRRLYWTGSHVQDIKNRLNNGIRGSRISAGRLR